LRTRAISVVRTRTINVYDFDGRIVRLQVTFSLTLIGLLCATSHTQNNRLSLSAKKRPRKSRKDYFRRFCRRRHATELARVLGATVRSGPSADQSRNSVCRVTYSQSRFSPFA
jgi:hypothetical protein